MDTQPTQKSNNVAPIAEDTMGPYYHHSFLDGDRCDLIIVHAGLAVRPEGQQISLRGRLLDSEGDPVADAVIEFWQANAAGVYRTPLTDGDPRLDPYFDGFGRLVTTQEPFVLKTVRPGEVAGDPPRAPHVTLTIFSDGITRLVTQIFFEGEPANADDPLLSQLPESLRPRLIARKASSDGSMEYYDIDIVMRGHNETPFFDDLSS